MSINDSVYEALMKSTFPVQLERDGEMLPPLNCRSLPFTTLMSLLGEVAISAKAELHEAKRRVIQDVIATGITSIPTDQLTDIIMPLVSSVLFDSPRLTRLVLMDVVVGMTDDKIVLFSIEDVVSILDEVIKRLDVNRVSEKARGIFTQAAAVVGKALETQSKKEHNLEQAQKSLSQKA